MEALHLRYRHDTLGRGLCVGVSGPEQGALYGDILRVRYLSCPGSFRLP